MKRFHDNDEFCFKDGQLVIRSQRTVNPHAPVHFLMLPTELIVMVFQLICGPNDPPEKYHRICKRIRNILFGCSRLLVNVSFSPRIFQSPGFLQGFRNRLERIRHLNDTCIIRPRSFPIMAEYELGAHLYGRALLSDFTRWVQGDLITRVITTNVLSLVRELWIVGEHEWNAFYQYISQDGRLPLTRLERLHIVQMGTSIRLPSHTLLPSLRCLEVITSATSLFASSDEELKTSCLQTCNLIKLKANASNQLAVIIASCPNLEAATVGFQQVYSPVLAHPTMQRLVLLGCVANNTFRLDMPHLRALTTCTWLDYPGVPSKPLHTHLAERSRAGPGLHVPLDVSFFHGIPRIKWIRMAISKDDYDTVSHALLTSGICPKITHFKYIAEERWAGFVASGAVTIFTVLGREDDDWRMIQ